MNISGAGSVIRAEKKDRAKCRRWRLKVRTDQGIKGKRFTGTYTEAQKALSAFIDELREQQAREDITFAEYADKWLAYRKNCGDFAISTLEKNERQLKSIYLYIGDVPITEIKPETVRDLLVDLRQGKGTLSGKQVGGTYANQIYTLLKCVLKSALTDDLIPSNPCDKVSPPKKDTDEKTVLSSDQLAVFLSIMKSLPLSAHSVGAQLAVLAGLRRGEVCGLHNVRFIAIL